jgi:hypothetical protein
MGRCSSRVRPMKARASHPLPRLPLIARVSALNRSRSIQTDRCLRRGSISAIAFRRKQGTNRMRVRPLLSRGRTITGRRFRTPGSRRTIPANAAVSRSLSPGLAVRWSHSETYSTGRCAITRSRPFSIRRPRGLPTASALMIGRPTSAPVTGPVSRYRKTTPIT